MSRLKSLLMYAGLLGSLFGFSVTGSFAQTVPEGTSASLLRGPEQRVALVIGNSHYKNAPELASNSLRLVDLMATLESIPSRMRIVLLDACRNNPFPGVNDAGRGLAIVDAPNGSIVGYSTAPGTEALDGTGEHSPYLQAFLNLASIPNLPIEQLFKRMRLDVAGTTAGKQVPWESSSLTSD